MKYIIYLIFCILVASSCGQRNARSDAAGNHEAHDHAEHAHEAHGNAEHAHEAHDHAGHDHKAHNHAEHAHEAHGHAEHGHDCDLHGHEHDSAEAEHAEHPAGEIIFPAAQAALTDFAVERIEPGTFREVIRTSGQILPAQGDQVCLSAPVEGIISFAETKLSDGSLIGKGRNVFYISSKDIASGDAGAKTQANYLRAKAEYERMEELLADRIVTRRDYEAAKAEYLQAKAEWDAISSVTSPKGTAVVSPMSGYVIQLDVHEGDFVAMGQVLATISRNRRLELRAEVSQKYYPQLRNIRSAQFRNPYGEEMLSLDELGGRLLSVGQATSMSGYMVPVTFEFDNPGHLVSGLYVEAYLLGGERDGVLSVPLSALTEQQGIYYVYVQLDAETYLRREVKPGADNGLRVEILSGLEAGERVVTRGAAQVKMASASGEIPHGHSH